MTLTDTQTRLCREFRAWIDASLEGDPRFGEPVREDREDNSTLTTRYPMANALYLEIALRPLIPQVRVGIVTDDRWRSEELEDKVEESGDSMGEFLEVPFAEAGLDWDEPPVEHYRADGKWFSFITPLDLDGIGELADDAVRHKVRKMIEGYVNSYGQA
jgi:hypothetical protein